MTPGWKVKRELIRLWQQLKAIPEFFWEPLAIRAHNAAFEKGFPTFDGNIPVLPKIAIVLCFQPKGLAKSFFITLAHLVKNGYAPLVISNSKLSDADKEKLKDNAWRVVERPNFGYDFGGYRDGVLLLEKWKIKPNHLVIMNDSIWFPVWKDDKTLENSEKAEFDVAGMIIREKSGNQFLESYFLSIKNRVLISSEFIRFWDEIKLTSNKYKVIRGGERGFGMALKKMGFQIGPLFSEAFFIQEVSKATFSNLKKSIYYLCADDTKLMKEAHDLSAKENKASADEILRFIKKSLHKRMFYSTFPVFAANAGLYPAIKKSNGAPRNRFWRQAMLQAFECGDLLEPIPEVLDELRVMVKNQISLN